jgi:hypothetical protein
MAFCVKGLCATLSMTMLYHNADCCILFIVMLNAYMLSDVMLNREHSLDIYVLNVAMLSVIAPFHGHYSVT